MNYRRQKMEKIIVLGTGSGITVNCYSLSALLENNEGNYLLMDTGSGNGNVYVPNDLDEVIL